MVIEMNTTSSQIKNRVLVVADQQTYMVDIITSFFDAGWLTDAVSTQSWMSRNSQTAKNYNRIVLVIDSSFRRRFGNIIQEMGAIVKNCSAHAPVYLMCENGYEPCLSPWLPHVKQVLEFEAERDSLRYTIDYIVSHKAESAVSNNRPSTFAYLRSLIRS